MYDSYGDGWNGADYTIAQGAQTLATGTLRSGSFESDTLSNIPVGTLSITVTRGSWPSEISWALKDESGNVILDSSLNTFPTEMSFTVSSSGGGGVFETALSSTTSPNGASHLLAFSSLSDGSTSPLTWVSLVDFAPPASFPSSLAFSDTDASAGVIAGVITIGRAADETGVAEYKVYFGTNTSTKLDQQAVVSVSASTSGSPLLVNLPATSLPGNASQFLVFTASDGGENPQPVAASISDLIIPTSAPSAASFTDMDPEAGVYSGVVHFQGAEDESIITHYQLYWGSSSSTPAFSSGLLGSVAASPGWHIYFINLNSTAAPAGMTHLVVVSANGENPMQSGVGVALVDFVTISVVPSNVSFVDMDPSLQQISGTVTIAAAADESEVASYAVYWGVSPTVRLPGGAPGLNAEFFALSSCPCSSCFPDFSTLGTPFLSQVENASAYSASRPGGSFSIWPGLDRSEHFAARWTGWFQVISGGDFWFRVDSDDRAKLFVDSVEVQFSDGWGFLVLSSGIHQVEMQYFQCVGASFISAFLSGLDTNWFDVSLWARSRNGAQEQAALATASKTGADVPVTIPSTSIPSGATHLLVFARSAAGLDSVNSIGTELVDVVKPSLTAELVSFTDTDPYPNIIQGVITIKRAQNEHDINFYKIYWGSSATTIVTSGARRLATVQPSCTGVACGDIVITEGSLNEWTVSRENYGNYEQAFITLTGPAEIHFNFVSTETCCDKLYFPNHSPISGYDQAPGPITLPDGSHSVEWSSDYSVTSSGWSFTYKYQGSASTPGLVAFVPKPSGSQDLFVLLERVVPPGTHFIVKSAYNSSESDASVAVQIQDLAPADLGVGEVSFTDTNGVAGNISGDVVIGEGSSGVLGFNVYWGQDSSTPILAGSPGLWGEYFYLSSTAMPDFTDLVPDLVQVDSQLAQSSTYSGWPGTPGSANVAARWTGYINITTAGRYIFTLSSSDHSQLFINEALVVERQGVVWESSSGDVYLLPGLHALQVLYYNNCCSYGIVLDYSGPDTWNLQTLVPARVLRHGSLNSALIGQVAAAASGNTVYQIQNLAIPSAATYLLVKAYSAEGEGLNTSSVQIQDAFTPIATASGVYFLDEDPSPGQIAGTIQVQPAADQSSVSHYMIYWGSSATAKLSLLGQVSASGSGASLGSCGVKGPDSTPLRFSRNGVNGPKIVNGQDASHCEWRWQVSLRTSYGFHFCGATLISPRWVMSAAHCIDGSTFVVVVGDYNKDSHGDEDEREHTVLRTVVNPNYTESRFNHDFALIELEQEVEMGGCAAAACLPFEDIGAGQECFITGWGTLSSGGSSPSHVQEGLVLTLSNEECAERYQGQDDILPNMLCAQGTSSLGIVDSCQGDSGGPLVCPGADGRYYLHGATSWGYGCAQAQYPGVYARVSAVMPWVQSVTGLEGAGSGGNMTLTITSQSIPASATHLLVFTAMNGLEMTSGISFRLVDYSPIPAVPTSISFTDTDASPGELGGVITLGRATDESEVTGYAVYWGSISNGTSYYGLIGEVPKGPGTGNVEISLAPNTVKPDAATHLLGFATSSSGRGASYVEVQIVDINENVVPGDLTQFESATPCNVSPQKCLMAGKNPMAWP